MTTCRLSQLQLRCYLSRQLQLRCYLSRPAAQLSSHFWLNIHNIPAPRSPCTRLCCLLDWGESYRLALTGSFLSRLLLTIESGSAMLQSIPCFVHLIECICAGICRLIGMSLPSSVQVGEPNTLIY